MTLILAGVALSTTVSMFVAIAAGIRAVGRLTRELERAERRLAYERLYRDVMLVDVPEWVSGSAVGHDNS